jgi:phytoene dehydrogenase-like protein
MLQRFLADDEAAKFAVAANIAYYADDPRRMAWPFFAMAQGGFLKSGGVFVRGGSRTLSMKLARIVMKAGGSVLLGREAVGVDLDSQGRPAFVRHADAKNRAAQERVGASQVLANCAPSTLAAMLPESARGALERAYGGRALSISLFSAHFGLSAPPARFGLDRYGQIVLPDWIRSLRELGDCGRLLAADPAGRLPAYGIANYGAIDSGLADGGPILISVVGVDRFDNWSSLTPAQEKDRRERWLDAFQGALERDYPGFGAAVSERLFLNARSMRGFLNTPDGAVYGFAPLPPERGVWAGIPRSPRTPVPGLYLASSFAGMGGFTGAMRSGAEAARAAMAEKLG